MKTEFGLQVEERAHRLRTGPRYGVKATAEAANALKAAANKYPDDMELYQAASAMIDLGYRQSNWIEKFWLMFVRGIQEAER